MKGVRHLIQCHCILPQYRKSKEPVFHKFVAFSIIDENEEAMQKIVECNNCGVVHRIIDVCRSEIVHKIEDARSIVKIDVNPRLYEFSGAAKSLQSSSLI